MALKSISFGSLQNFHIYDDTVHANGISLPVGTQASFHDVQLSGRLDVIEYFRQRWITATQITANKDNFDLWTDLGGDYTNVRISSDASRDITGIVSKVDGFHLRLINTGSNNIVIKHDSASSTAANRFYTQSAGDLTLAANQAALFIYDTTSARWREV